MPKITFKPKDISVNAEPDSFLLDVAKEAGVAIDAPCGGKGTCGKCIVKIVRGEVNSDSLGVLSRVEVSDGFVLACKTKIMSSDVVVEIPEQSEREGGKFTDAEEDTLLVRHDLFPKKWHFDPMAVKWYIDVPLPQLEDGMSDLDRFIKRIQQDWGKKKVVCDIAVIRHLAEILRAENGNVTISLIREPERFHVIAVEPGNQTIDNYGIAVDIGTTTIAVQLVNLSIAKVIATLSDYNDQVSCGLDVISRINYARKPERLEELRTRVLGTINKLISKLSKNYNIGNKKISNAVISGNTTMVHLLLGLNPEYIRLEPYTPTLLRSPRFTARDVGIDIHPQSWVYISPNVGSYVGGDITAGILCTDLASDTEDINLFIDIGTNGEIVLGNSDFLMTCACSAGPAFEGGGIGCGMRAALGAIEKVEINSETGEAYCQTVGNVLPKGICGSGMISLVANLFKTGWLDASGKFSVDKKSDSIIVEGRRAKYIIVPADKSSNGEDLSINELDIENIIRAKAAIYSACALMIEQVGITFDDLSKIYIAGGFGRFLDLDNATVLGLVPDLPREKFQYIGNSSLTGSYMILVSQEFREKQVALAERMTYMELSTDPSYMDQYTGALFIPHTDPKLFPSVMGS